MINYYFVLVLDISLGVGALIMVYLIEKMILPELNVNDVFKNPEIEDLEEEKK